MFSLRRSAIDPRFFEILDEGNVVEEIAISFLVRRIPTFHTREEIAKWLEATEKKLAKGIAYRSLARKSSSKRDLQGKLVAKGISHRAIEEILQELESLGYVNDASHFERAIERELSRGYGPKYIQMKLSIPVRVDVTKQEAALRKALPKYQKKERPQVIRAMLRRGFDLELILKALRDVP